jgi:3-hydroxyisobutyrate dehydrogenase-like beta-hydroxyacid dehydrogenase
MPDTLGFIGLGNMGLPMARNLLAAGHALRVYNRTADKAQPLVEAGAQLVSSPAEAVEPGGIVLTMLADDAALNETVTGANGLLSRLGANGLHISHSTISPALATHLAELHQRQGSAYLAAPVFGRPEAAAARTLWIVTAGSPEAKQRARPLLDALGQGVFDFGETPSAANVLKLAGNFLIASAMEAMAEAFTLGQKYGIERQTMADFLGNALFASSIYQNYGNAIAQPEQAPLGFRLPLGLKDVTLALQAAAEAPMPMPLASLIQQRFQAALAKGWGDKDWSQGIAFGVADDAGVGPTSRS